MQIGRIKFNKPKTSSSRKSKDSKSKSSRSSAGNGQSADTSKARKMGTANARKSKSRDSKIPKPGFWGVSARVVMIVFASLLVLSCVSVFINPVKLWFMNLLGLIFLPLFLINVILICWAARRRSWSSVIPLVALIPACFFFTRYVQPFHKTVEESVTYSATADIHEPNSESAYAGQSTVAHGSIYNADHPQWQIRILSYNVGRFALSGTFSNVRECSDSLLLYLSKTDSDIICLQEFYALDSKSLESYIHRYLPDYSVNSYMFNMKCGCFGNVTLSRLPVVDKGKELFPESRNLAIYTEYGKGDDRFRVYNCHLESYAVSLANIWKILKGDKQVFMETGQRMRRSILRRPQQVDKVLSSIENCHLKSFVCGDFNDSPISNTYYRVSRGRVDSFVKAGHGFGASFGPFWPFIRIDYIFSPDEFTPLSHYTPKMKYSDHYPIISDIRLGGSI